MARYALYSYENLYGGLHGMCYRTVVECENITEANQQALDNCFSLIESYACIYEVLDEAFEECRRENMFDDELIQLHDDIYTEDTAYEVWLIDETKAAKYSTHQLDAMFYDMEEDFYTRFCANRIN